MDHYDLRRIRKNMGITQAEVSRIMGVSPVQVYRIETGRRRLTIDSLEKYCGALGIEVLDIFRKNIKVPVIGVINIFSEVRPLPPDSMNTTIAPPLVNDTENLAAVRWEPEGHMGRMANHLEFFYKNISGVPEDAWGQRCYIRRKNGSSRTGWPILQDGQIHIEATQQATEYDVELISASPILAVISPYLLSHLEPSRECGR